MAALPAGLPREGRDPGVLVMTARALEAAGDEAPGFAVRAAYFALVFWIPVETVYFIKGEAGGGGITLSRLLGLVVVALAVFDWRRCFRRLPPAFWTIAWYLAVYGLSQLAIPRELDIPFREQQMTLIQMAALFLISLNLLDDAGYRESLLRFYGWWVGVVALIMNMGGFTAQFGRSTVTEQDPNITAGFFAFGILCLAGDPRLIAPGRFKARALAAPIVIAVLIMAILQTGSRGGLVVLTAGILGLCVCGGPKTRPRRMAMACAAAGALTLLIAREYTAGTSTATRLDQAWNDGDTAGRTLIWDTAWGMVFERPLLGFGGANNLFTLGIRMNYPFRDTHNLLLAVLTEVGLIGSGPMLAAMLLAVWSSWRHGGRTGDALPFALMVALIALNASLTGYHLKLFWIIFAAAAACGTGRAVPEAAA